MPSSSSSSSSSSSAEHEAAPPQQGPVSAEHSTVEPKVDSLQRYESTSFETHLIDDTLHEPKKESSCTVSLADADSNEVTDFDLATNGGEGVFTSTYTGHRAGTYTVSVRGDDVLIAQWTVTVHPAPVDPANSSVTPQETVRDRYQDTEFAITLNDSHSNPVFGVSPTVHIEGGDSFGVSVAAGDAENVFNVKYSPDLHGDFPISVSAGDIALASWTVHVNPAPVDAGTSSVDPQETTREIGQETTFTITLNDSHSNPVSGVEPTVAIEGAGFAAAVSGSDNVYTAVYTPDAAGDYPISVTAGDVALASWTVNVPAPPAPEPEPEPEPEKNKSKSSSSSSSSSSD